MIIGFQIPIISGIPHFVSCVSDSNSQDFGFLRKDSRIPEPEATISGFRISDSLKWGNLCILVLGGREGYIFSFFVITL